MEEKFAENDEKFGAQAQLDLYEKLVGPYYRAVERIIKSGGSISSKHPTYQKMINGSKEYQKQVKVLERKFKQGNKNIANKYYPLLDEAADKYEVTIATFTFVDGVRKMLDGEDFTTKDGKTIPGKRTISAKQRARVNEVKAEQDEIREYFRTANFEDNMIKPFVLYDVRTKFSKYGMSGESWSPEKKGSGLNKPPSSPPNTPPSSSPKPADSNLGSAGSYVGGDATAAAIAAAFNKDKRNKNNKNVNESNLFERIKSKPFFNPKDIKPPFPENDPPQLDPKTGMHPRYGKQSGRYKKLDPISANAMPPTGDPEIDAVVDKQRTKPKSQLFSKIKRLTRKG